MVDPKEPEDNLVIEANDGTLYLLLTPTTLGTIDDNPVEGPTGLLGKGLFGTVSLALTQDRQRLAAKLITLDKNDPQYTAQLAEIQKECAIMKHLGRKADIIEVPSDNKNEMKLYVMQEYLVGTPLKKYFADLNKEIANLEPGDEVGIMRVISKGLSAFVAACEATKELHDKGVIHGDLHTGNILYDPRTGQARVLDFGTSHILGVDEDRVFVPGEDSMSHIHRAPETLTSEARREGHGDERVYFRSSDLFALGVDFAIDSELFEKIPENASKEIGALLQVCYNMSRSPDFNGFPKSYKLKIEAIGSPEARFDLNTAINTLKLRQRDISVYIAHQIAHPISQREIDKAFETYQKKTTQRRKAMVLSEMLGPTPKFRKSENVVQSDQENIPPKDHKGPR